MMREIEVLNVVISGFDTSHQSVNRLTISVEHQEGGRNLRTHGLEPKGYYASVTFSEKIGGSTRMSQGCRMTGLIERDNGRYSKRKLTKVAEDLRTDAELQAYVKEMIALKGVNVVLSQKIESELAGLIPDSFKPKEAAIN
ncbi:hypothetical protein [Vibrio mediterranei]|uniref:hypothetical protein n=1 Tax=Vibrio mediterranei TaxID=689 RepID=UPI0040691321